MSVVRAFSIVRLDARSIALRVLLYCLPFAVAFIATSYQLWKDF